MSRTEIVNELADRMFLNPTKEDKQLCENFCNTFTDMVKDLLLDDQEIQWTGLFTLKVVDIPPRKGRNPSTNQVEEFPATKKVVCKLSRNLKHMISGK
jgi:nucleoid DNA-binding protein